MQASLVYTHQLKSIDEIVSNTTDDCAQFFLHKCLLHGTFLNS